MFGESAEDLFSKVATPLRNYFGTAPWGEIKEEGKDFKKKRTLMDILHSTSKFVQHMILECRQCHEFL
jgi:hypothetical protein